MKLRYNETTLNNFKYINKFIPQKRKKMWLILIPVLAWLVRVSFTHRFRNEIIAQAQFPVRASSDTRQTKEIQKREQRGWSMQKRG